MALAGEEEKTLEFQGTVAAVDLAGNTLTVRTRQKEFVFQVDPERCAIVKDGRDAAAPPPTLRNAVAGDSVVGNLIVERGKPVVTHLYLTTKPESGVLVPEKPGFIVSPYRSAPAGEGAIDVRGYQRGSMLVDKASGKIFLVP